MIARYDPAFPHNPHQPETFTMSSAQQHIIALAGGGFSMEPQNLALDRYILDQANTARPAVCFLPTASGDASQYIVNFFAAYTQFDCRPSYIPLFSRTPDLHSLLLNQDVIFVGGGNTKSMLAGWQAWGLPAILREAWQAGVVLAGVSAGAICWFEQGVTDSGANSLGVLDVPLREAAGIESIDPARGEVRMPVVPELCNAAGTLQGAMVALVAESAVEDLVAARTGAAVYVSDLDIRYLGKATDGVVRATTRAIGSDPWGVLEVELADEATGRVTTHVYARAVPAEGAP